MENNENSAKEPEKAKKSRPGIFRIVAISAVVIGLVYKLSGSKDVGRFFDALSSGDSSALIVAGLIVCVLVVGLGLRYLFEKKGII